MLHQRIIHSSFQDGLANPSDAESLKTYVVTGNESSAGYPGSTYLMTQKFEFNWTVMGNMDKVNIPKSMHEPGLAFIMTKTPFYHPSSTENNIYMKR